MPAAVRWHQFKINGKTCDSFQGPQSDYGQIPAVYNIEIDPGKQHNIAGEQDFVNNAFIKNCNIKETREVGRAKMYKLNLDSPVVKKFIELDNAICDLYASKLEKQEALLDTQENESSQRHILA